MQTVQLDERMQQPEERQAKNCIHKLVSDTASMHRQDRWRRDMWIWRQTYSDLLSESPVRQLCTGGAAG